MSADLDALKQDIERRMRGLADQDLQRLAAITRHEHTDEALQIAEAELRRRGLSVLSSEEYLGRFPGERVTETGFCVNCVEQTTEENLGSLRIKWLVPVFLGIGTWVSGDDDPCPICKSIVQSKAVWVGIPVWRLGRYRVVYPDGRADVELSGGRSGPLLSRKVRGH